MRKDLRLGLGIGALATVFAVTFLVVRSHTRSQASDAVAESADAAGGDLGGTAPEANTAAAAGATPDVPPVPASLPALQPVPRTGALPALPKIAADDPFARRQVRSGEAPMPGPAGKAAGGKAAAGNGKPAAADAAQDWDLLLAHGGPVTGSSMTGSPALERVPGGRSSLAAPPRAQTARVADRGADVRPARAGGSPSAAAGRPYTVRDGDTFTSIAKAVYGSAKYYLQIEQANHDVNPNRLMPGQEIVLPELSAEARSVRAASGPFARDEDNRPVNARTEYRVDAGDSLYRIATRVYGTSRMMDAIYDANRTAIGPNPERLRFGMILQLPRSSEQASGR